jgi:hypothetical protein
MIEVFMLFLGPPPTQHRLISHQMCLISQRCLPSILSSSSELSASFAGIPHLGEFGGGGGICAASLASLMTWWSRSNESETQG